MGIDFDFYRKANGLDDIPENNGNEQNTEMIERVSKMLKDTTPYYISTFDLYKRQNRLEIATRLRYKTTDEIGIHVYYKKIKEPTLNSLARGLYADHNTLKAGDYITYTDGYSGIRETYIIRNKPESKRTYEDAFMMFCNREIRWVDENKQVIKYPALVSHDKYIIGVEDEGFFETEGSWVIMMIQANPDTLKINTNDRFLLLATGDDMYTAHEVVDTNPHAIEGMIFVKVRTVKVTPDDNLELGIANYYSKMGEVIVPDDSEVLGQYQLLLGDTNKYSVSGVNLLDYTWTLEHVTGDLTISQYTDMSVDETGVLSVTSVSTSNSKNFEFDIVLTNNATSVEFLRKRIGVIGW